MYELINPYDEKSIIVKRFKEVTRLRDGCSFGELGLLKNAGRAATITCAKQTVFATLNRSDYTWTIG